MLDRTPGSKSLFSEQALIMSPRRVTARLNPFSEGHFDGTANRESNFFHTAA